MTSAAPQSCGAEVMLEAAQKEAKQFPVGLMLCGTQFKILIDTEMQGNKGLCLCKSVRQKKLDKVIDGVL